jgi:hypothetical protein
VVDSQARADVIKDLAPSLAGLDPGAQTEAINAAIQGPDSKTANLLWTILVPGLLALAGVALLGLILLLAFDKSADPAVTAFTAVLTGLLGFFAPSPVAGKDNQNAGG